MLKFLASLLLAGVLLAPALGQATPQPDLQFPLLPTPAPVPIPKVEPTRLTGDLLYVVTASTPHLLLASPLGMGIRILRDSRSALVQCRPGRAKRFES